jgi:hypothetical protein
VGASLTVNDPRPSWRRANALTRAPYEAIAEWTAIRERLIPDAFGSCGRRPMPWDFQAFAERVPTTRRAVTGGER